MSDHERAGNYANAARNVKSNVWGRVFSEVRRAHIRTRGRSQISHHTGAKFIAFSLQSNMLIPLARHSPPIQKMYRTQPTFHAERKA